MSLVWHIVRKDFRRVGGALGLWLLLVLGHAWILFEWEGQMGTNPSALEAKRYFVHTCGAIVAGIGFVLAAWMVMEDNLASTQAFWRTRALSGGRLLVAKAAGALLMFSVLPVLVLTPLWLWCGFSFREWCGAALEWGLIQALCSLAALALGSITETSGQFLVRAIGAAIIVPTGWALTVPSALWEREYLHPTHSMLLIDGTILLVGLVVLNQFLTRRLVRSWLLLAPGFVLLCALCRWWPWDLSPAFRESNRDATGAVAAIVARLAGPPPKVSQTREVRGRFEGVPPGTYVRVDGVRAAWFAGAGDSTRKVKLLPRLFPPPEPAPELVRAVAGLPASDSPSVWTVNIPKIPFAFIQNESDFELRLELRASLMRGRVLGEMPLRAGEQLRVGSSLTRIKSVRWVDDDFVVLIEERDAWLSDAGRYSGSYNPEFRRIRPVEDGFIILNRRRGGDLQPATREIGTIRSNSIVVGRRELIISPPEGAAGDAMDRLPGWLEDAVLVKVRFAPEGTLTRIVSGHR